MRNTLICCKVTVITYNGPVQAMLGWPLTMDVGSNNYFIGSPNMPPFGLFEEHESSDSQDGMQKASCRATARL